MSSVVYDTWQVLRAGTPGVPALSGSLMGDAFRLTESFDRLEATRCPVVLCHAQHERVHTLLWEARYANTISVESDGHDTGVAYAAQWLNH